MIPLWADARVSKPMPVAIVDHHAIEEGEEDVAGGEVSNGRSLSIGSNSHVQPPPGAHWLCSVQEIFLRLITCNDEAATEALSSPFIPGTGNSLSSARGRGA